jgi:hypothetical protein
MTDDDNITPAAARARKAAYDATMDKLKPARTRPSVDLTVPWKFPPLAEVDEWFADPTHRTSSPARAAADRPDTYLKASPTARGLFISA